MEDVRIALYADWNHPPYGCAVGDMSAVSPCQTHVAYEVDCRP